MKHNKKCILVVITILVLSSLLCACSFQKKEIVWYISDPENYGVKSRDLKEYQEIKTERFQAFNDRLKELNIPAKVVFKYVSNKYESRENDLESDKLEKKVFLFETKLIEKILQNDEEADIAGFSLLEYDKFAVLDDYLKKEENKKIFTTLLDVDWKVNEINQKTYQIPKANVIISQPTYLFFKPFVEKYQVHLDKETISRMSPEEVIAFLKPYFEKERLLDDRFYLTSADNLPYNVSFQKKYIPVLRNSRACNIAIDVEENKIVNLLDTTEMKKMLKCYQVIYNENWDAHIERQYKSGMPVFSMTDIPTVTELTQEKESRWIEIPFAERCIVKSFGNGVLKTSSEKELAVQVLAASMYDEELSNIMIHGVQDQDYQLENGYVNYADDRKWTSSMGSFSGIGNNRIAYPNKSEVKEKKEVTEQVLENVEMQLNNQFTPFIDNHLAEKLGDIIQIYSDMENRSMLENISDFDEFVRAQEIILENAKVREVVCELQKQLDEWKE